MDFHLSFPVPELPSKIDYTERILLIGSCFSENIGTLLNKYKFNTTSNPNGILYNPTSVAMCLQRIIDNKKMEEKELFFANDCWNSWEHHSSFSSIDKQECLANINDSIMANAATLKNLNWLFLTFGSAHSYFLTENDQPVANCHKVPQKQFNKKLLTVVEIVKTYNRIIEQLTEVNPQLKIVFTISPVRYIRDGVIENNISKSRLINAVHELVNQNDRCFYFAAYELVIDDLRDYRFYKKDLVHPNELAIDYVFEKLKDAVFSKATNHLFDKINDLITAKNHRPFNANAPSHIQFKATYLQRCLQLKKEYPFLNLEEELKAFEN